MLNRLQRLDPHRRRKKRVGRGRSSGHGKQCGRGAKGAGARTGRVKPRVYEGGQMPLPRRLPKRGFRNIFKKEYHVINVDRLANNYSPADRVDEESLRAKGLIKGKKDILIKLLSRGEVRFPLNIFVHATSKGAQQKIISAGGSINLIQ